MCIFMKLHSLISHWKIGPSGWDFPIPTDVDVLGFNHMLTLVGHFVLSPREWRKEIKEIVEEMKERDGEERGTGMKGKKQMK